MAKPGQLERQETEDHDLSEFQSRLAEFLGVFEDCSLIDGRLVTDIAITGGTPLKVDHKLNRVPEGWIVVRINANAVVFENSDSDTAQLDLDASANVTVDLWVF